MNKLNVALCRSLRGMADDPALGCQAADEIEVLWVDRAKLRAELSALRQDAGRYRWLRDGGDYYLRCINPEAGIIEGEPLDHIIDIALKRRPS